MNKQISAIFLAFHPFNNQILYLTARHFKIIVKIFVPAEKSTGLYFDWWNIDCYISAREEGERAIILIFLFHGNPCVAKVQFNLKFVTLYQKSSNFPNWTQCYQLIDRSQFRDLWRCTAGDIKVKKNPQQVWFLEIRSMKIWTNEHIFNHSWETVAQNQWRK